MSSIMGMFRKNIADRSKRIPLNRHQRKEEKLTDGNNS